MALLRQFYTNFTSGELSPLLSSRIDTEAYSNGAKTIRNCRIRAQGGATRRPGSSYLQTLSNIPYQMERYIYDEDEAYILLFSNTRLDIVDLADTSTILETITSCPWTTNEIGKIVVSQSGDKMIIVNTAFSMRELTRLSATDFDLSEYTFYENDGIRFTSYYKFAAASTTITFSSTSAGSRTVTASADAFTANMVNTYLRLVDTSSNIRFAKITAYTSATQVTATLNTALANAVVTDWQEEVFSAKRGYARTVLFHDQRLVFGGSLELPNYLFLSKVGEFTDFEVGTSLDDEGMQVQIAENQVSEIKALASLRHLTIFTSEQELYVPTTENRPLTPSTITVKKQTSFGSGNVQPVEFDGAVVYLTKSKGAVREFIYSDISQAYNSDALTILSTDLIGTPNAIEAQREASDQVEGYLFIVNSDGHMPVFMSIRKENLQGWVRYETNGSYKNIVNVNREIYMVVERTVNSGTVTYLEKMDNTRFLDASVNKVSGSATTSYQIAHMPNTTVHVRSGNYSLGSYTTDGSGNLTLSSAVTSCEIGMNFTPQITTLPPEFQLEDGVSVGQKRRIVRAVLDLYETLNVKAKGTTILIRSVIDDFSQEPSKLTTRKEVYLLGWSKDGTVTITSDDPLPMSINGILLEVEI